LLTRKRGPRRALNARRRPGDRPLAAPAESSHKGCMSKLKVEFKYKRIAEDDWQIEAHYPGVEIRDIKGFKSKAEVDEWLQGSRRVDWLRSQGYAK
jgi:hypothetical protein